MTRVHYRNSDGSRRLKSKSKLISELLSISEMLGKSRKRKCGMPRLPDEDIRAQKRQRLETVTKKRGVTFYNQRA